MKLDLLDCETSTVRLVYEALIRRGRASQTELSSSINRTPSAICKALKALTGGGYAKLAGKEPNGHNTGKRIYFYESTGKRITTPTETESMNEQAELLRIMHGFVAQRGDNDRK